MAEKKPENDDDKSVVNFKPRRIQMNRSVDVIESWPADFQAVRLSGISANEAGDYQLALERLKKVVELDPTDAEIFSQLGFALVNLRLERFALLYLDRAIALRPEDSKAHNTRGLAFVQTRQYDAAICDLERAIALNPNFSDAWVNLGSAFSLMGHDADAMRCYMRAVALKPDFPDAHVNMSVLLLAKCCFENGWAAYEWRMKTKKWGARPATDDKPLWSGVKSDKRLLVHKEQGPGEQLLFGSILPDLAGFPQEITVSLDKRLIPLFERSIPFLKYVDKEVPVPEDSFDEQIRVGSLAQYFRTSIDDFSVARSPYLFAQRELTQELRVRLRQARKFVCGVSWSSRNTALGENKSATLKQLLPILQNSDCEFVDLQYGDTSEERMQFERETGIHIRKFDEIDNMKDLDALASLISACDLVITTSNTTAHLAGALGQRTLLMVQRGNQVIWYWSTVNGKCLWYPSVTIFKQHAPHDWSGCVNDIRSELKGIICSQV